MWACGPSANEVKDIDRLVHPLIDFMIINKPEPRIKQPRYWVFCDHSQYARNKDYWNKYTGTVINPVSIRTRRSKQVLIKHKAGKGFSSNLHDGYHIGRSTTYANMQVAHWMGYDRIYIFGIDMREVKGKLERYGNGRNPDVADNIRKGRFKYEAESYQHAANILKERSRRRFFFCSSYNPWDFVEKYSRLDHKKAVQVILDHANKLAQK